MDNEVDTQAMPRVAAPPPGRVAAGEQKPYEVIYAEAMTRLEVMAEAWQAALTDLSAPTPLGVEQPSPSEAIVAAPSADDLLVDEVSERLKSRRWRRSVLTRLRLAV